MEKKNYDLSFLQDNISYNQYSGRQIIIIYYEQFVFEPIARVGITINVYVYVNMSSVYISLPMWGPEYV